DWFSELLAACGVTDGSFVCTSHGPGGNPGNIGTHQPQAFSNVTKRVDVFQSRGIINLNLVVVNVGVLHDPYGSFARNFMYCHTFPLRGCSKDLNFAVCGISRDFASAI